MDADDDVVVFHDAPERVPVVAVDARQTFGNWVVGEADGAAAFGGDTSGFGDAGIDVPQWQDGEWNETAGSGATPFVDVPVVVGTDDLFSKLLVGGLQEEGAGEGRKGREVERGQDAVDVHVVDAVHDLVGAFADLAVGGWFHAVFFRRTTNHGIQTEVRYRTSFVDPGI